MYRIQGFRNDDCLYICLLVGSPSFRRKCVGRHRCRAPVCLQRWVSGRRRTAAVTPYATRQPVILCGIVSSKHILIGLIINRTSQWRVPMSEISSGLQAVPRIKASYARYIFWVMFAISFLNYLDRSILSGAVNEIAKELHFGIEGIGFISSAFLVVYTLGIMPLGVLADRMARKNVVAACVAIWSTITALTALSTSFATLFISRMLLGIGEAGYFPAGTALMSDYFSREKRSRILSWWSVAQVVGILFGTAIGGIVAGLYTGA